jgi:DnaJ-class molecular chaperone
LWSATDGRLMKDPYTILGVPRTVSAEELKQTYRRLAKQLHPDLNPGNAAIEHRFKEVTAAYELLSDPEKRARFDRGEIDASGAERGFRYQRRESGGPRRGRREAEDFSVDDIIEDILRRKRGGAPRSQRGSDAAFNLTVPFMEAAIGARKRVTLAEGKTLEISVPPGIESGQKMRLKGQGNPGQNGGEAGDALIEITVEPHAVFSRRDRDIICELEVTLPEALLGATVTAPTVHGPVALKVPPGSNSGTVLRLKGKGLPERAGAASGDQYVKLVIMLPDPADPELTRLVEGWARKHPYEVRREGAG